MTVQLSSEEVQNAIAEYLRKHGVLGVDIKNIKLELRDQTGSRVHIQGYSLIVTAYDVKLPEGPYR